MTAAEMLTARPLQRGRAVALETLVVMALALGCGGLVKGATGMGLPTIALPILATFLDVPRAVALMSLATVVTNAVQVWRLRGETAGSRDFLPPLLVTGAVGIVLGTWLLTALPERILALILGLLLVFYVGLSLGKPSFFLTRPTARRIAPAVGLGAGLLQGATGISSPITVTYVHALRLPREAHVFAVSAMFLLYSLVQVPALALAGVLTWTLFLQGILALLPALLMMPVGTWLASKLSARTFNRLILGFLAIVAAQLLAKGLVL